MKRTFLLILIVALLFVGGCKADTHDLEIKIEDLQSRIDELTDTVEGFGISLFDLEKQMNE